MRKLRILGIVGLISGILVFLSGLVLLVLTFLAIVILLPFLPLVGGSIHGTIFLPALVAVGVGLLLIIVSIVAIVMGETRSNPVQIGIGSP